MTDLNFLKCPKNQAETVLCDSLTHQDQFTTQLLKTACLLWHGGATTQANDIIRVICGLSFILVDLTSAQVEEELCFLLEVT